MYSKFKVATNNSSFAMPESLIGYIADGGASYYFSRLCKTKELGMFLSLTGKTIYGEDIVKYGFANHYIKSEDLPKLR